MNSVCFIPHSLKDAGRHKNTIAWGYSSIAPFKSLRKSRGVRDSSLESEYLNEGLCPIFYLMNKTSTKLMLLCKPFTLSADYPAEVTRFLLVG